MGSVPSPVPAPPARAPRAPLDAAAAPSPSASPSSVGFSRLGNFARSAKHQINQLAVKLGFQLHALAAKLHLTRANEHVSHRYELSQGATRAQVSTEKVFNALANPRPSKLELVEALYASASTQPRSSATREKALGDARALVADMPTDTLYRVGKRANSSAALQTRGALEAMVNSSTDQEASHAESMRERLTGLRTAVAEELTTRGVSLENRQAQAFDRHPAEYKADKHNSDTKIREHLEQLRAASMKETKATLGANNWSAIGRKLTHIGNAARLAARGEVNVHEYPAGMAPKLASFDGKAPVPAGAARFHTEAAQRESPVLAEAVDAPRHHVFAKAREQHGEFVQGRQVLNSAHTIMEAANKDTALEYKLQLLSTQTIHEAQFQGALDDFIRAKGQEALPPGAPSIVDASGKVKDTATLIPHEATRETATSLEKLSNGSVRATIHSMVQLDSVNVDGKTYPLNEQDSLYVYKTSFIVPPGYGAITIDNENPPSVSVQLRHHDS